MKRMSLALALILVLGMGISVMAAKGDPIHSESITVEAYVAPYAELVWDDEHKYPAQYSGAANERPMGEYGFTLETNCKVGFTLQTTALTQTVDGVDYEIDRKGIHWSIWKPELGPTWGPGAGTGYHGWYKNRTLQGIGKQDWRLRFWATSGAISDQYAGTYTATVTITITSTEEHL